MTLEPKIGMLVKVRANTLRVRIVCKIEKKIDSQGHSETYVTLRNLLPIGTFGDEQRFRLEYFDATYWEFKGER